MFPAEVLSNHKAAWAFLQKSIADWVKVKYQLDLSPKGASESPGVITEVQAFCAMRFAHKKTSVAYPVGFGSPDQQKTFLNWVAKAEKSADEMAELQKEVEKDLCKVLYNTVEAVLGEKQVKLEAGTMLCMPQKSLFGWANVTVSKTLTLTFAAGGKDISFVLPLFDKKFYEEKTMESFGFNVNARILVVDDSATSRKLSRFALNLAGYMNVDECEDGDAAFNKLASSTPRIEFLVADWHMPNMSGFDLLKKVRADKELKATPVVLVTGEQNAQEVTDAIKAGVNGYVVKPFQPEVLYKSMKKAGTPPAAKKAA